MQFLIRSDGDLGQASDWVLVRAYRRLAVPRLGGACYAHMGPLDEARAIVARLRAITPLVMPSVLPWRNPEDRELFLSGLRLAAGEPT